MGNSTQQESRRQVALIGWGLRHDLGEGDDPADGIIMDMLEKKGYDVHIINGNLQPLYGVAYHIKTRKLVHAQRMSDLKVRGDIAKQVKGMGCKTAIFFVARSNQELQLAWGDLSIAGIELWLVPIEGYNQTPMPCTMRYKGDKEIGSHPFEAGSWVKHQVAGVTAYRWKEPRWSLEELANTTFPCGSVIMWKPEDYKELETHMASRWIAEVALAQKRKREILQEAAIAPQTALADLQKDYYAACNREAWYGELHGEALYGRLYPPDYVWEKVDDDSEEWVQKPMSYPHTLPLTGFRFSEVPLRYIDYLAGEPWIYGEFAQRLRAYHRNPIIQAEVIRFTPTIRNLNGKTMPDDFTMGSKGIPDDCRNLESNTTGYWKGDEYVSTGCIKGPSLKEVPTWLIAHDPSGRELRQPGGSPVKAKYNETPRETYFKNLERRGFADVECIRPDSWIFGTPWAFNNFKEADEDGEDEVEDKNLQDECRILEEEGDFARRPEMQRFQYNKPATRWDPQPEEKNHRNAWYTALQISEELAHTQDRAKGAQTPEHWNGERKGTARAELLSERLLGIERDLEAVIREANITCWTDPHLLELMADYYRLQEVLGLYLQDSQAGTPARKQSLLEEFRDITLQVTPLLIRMLGMGVREWLYQQAKEVLADIRAAARHSHQSPYIQQIMEVLEEHPETANKLLEVSKVMPDVVEEILQACPEFATKELQDSIKTTYKRRSRLFPELYTKKGKRRVTPTYEKVTA